MEQSYEVQPGVHVLPVFIPVPTLGLLAANAFLVRGEQPYLVDTGILAESEAFVRQVEHLVDPADLRWIYLTHTDPDHIGALTALLDRAPNAKVVTTFIALAKLDLGLRAIPPHRVLLLNPGERLELGDRTLTVLRPPVFDAPETTMVHDSKLDALFSADVFGAPLSEPILFANDLSNERLEPSQLLWTTVDSPWIHRVNRRGFRALLEEIADLDPAWVFSAHLPPARRMARTLCRNLSGAPDAAPFVAPNQPAFEAIVSGIAAAPPSPQPPP